jgi:hypothetical protein
MRGVTLAGTSGMLLIAFVATRGLAVTETDQSYNSSTLSSSSVRALVEAYRIKAPTTGALAAPFVLEKYSVELMERRGEVIVSFLPNIGSSVSTTTIRDGNVIARSSVEPELSSPPMLLPGVIAGEIIAAFDTAQQRNDVVVSNSGVSYEVRVDVWAGGSVVAFVPLRTPAELVKRKCLAGNCDGRTVYDVVFRGDRAQVKYRAIV